MGTVTGTTLINNAANELKDTANVRWLRPELLAWINEAQAVINTLVPRANRVVSAQKMVAGTRQSLPADGALLLDVTRNMGTNGSTPGAPVRIVSRTLMDAFQPTWHSDAAATAVTNYLFTTQEPTAYFVYPPSDGTGYIEVNYSQVPPTLSAEASAIGINDEYAPAVLCWMLYRACLKDAEYSPGAQLASAHMSAFQSLVAAKMTAEEKASANWGLLGSQPTTTGGKS